MVVKPDAFLGGQFYAVKLDVFDRQKSLVGSARRILAIDSPVNGGLKLTGESLQQFERLTLSADGWVDPDAPLQYLFSLQTAAATSTEIFLSEMLDVPQLSFVMPFSGQIRAFVRVFDSEGAESKFEISSEVSEAKQGRFDALRAAYRKALKLGDFRTANQYLFALLVAANHANDAAYVKSLPSSSSTLTY